MNPPEADAQRDEEDEERRRQAEALEELMMRQQQEEEAEDDGQLNPQQPLQPGEAQQGEAPVPTPSVKKLSYTQISFGAAVALLWYALRTRQQWYLALIYLSSSKWAYVVMGNALVALNVWLFQVFTSTFLGELRLVESEGLADFFRWNVTETCLALTMFRSELNVSSAILFLFLILNKCLHWVIELREQHMRMTQEAVVVGWKGLPMIPKAHRKLFWSIQVLLLVDVMAVANCAYDIYQHGPTIYLLFCFESGIMLVTAMSMELLWAIHWMDGLLHYIHEEATQHGISGMLHAWKDRKATVVFALQVQTQATKFFLYVAFFGIVLTYYGLPINLFREVYLSFQALKNRLVAFNKYRKLMQSMNRFDSVQTEEELEEAGKTCIICRDDMTLRDCKKLPGCAHVFHKSCLREWLVQQQTCPTCRSDITVNEARQRQRQVQAAAAEQNVQQAPQPPELERQVTDEQAREIAQQEVDRMVRATEQTAQEDHRDDHASAFPSPGEVQPPQDLLTDLAAEDDGDKKPSAATVPAPRKTPASTPAAPSKATVFPALYKVTNPEGANVHKSVLSTPGTVVRQVPVGTAVLCFSINWKQGNDTDESGMVLQIPDGWVWERDVDRMMDIQLPKASASE